MGPRASTKRSRTPSEDDEGQSTEEDSPNRVPTEGRVSPSNDDVKTYNDDERPTAVAKESDAARATRREYRRLIAEQDGFEDVPSCGRSDAKFHQGSQMVAVEGRDAWLKLLPEMMAICNEAARRQHLKNNPDAVCFDEPLSADYCYERVALAPDPLKGFIVREKKGAKRLQGFVLFHEFCGLAKSLVFDSRDPAALFGSYGSDGSVQRVFHRGNDIRTPLDLVKATDLVAEASNEDEVDRSKDDDGDLADTLTKQPRETRDAPRKDMFGGVIVVWPKLVEVSLCGALGCGGRLVRAALDQAKRDGMECVVLQAERRAIGFYEKLGLKRVGAVARFRDRADAPRLAYRHWCTRTVDEPSYMMAKQLSRGGKKTKRSVSIELDEEVCRARALELAHIAYLANAHAPGAAAAFRECLLLAVGYAGSAGCDDRGLALALADSLQTFRGSSDQKPDAREARKRLRTAFLERVNDSDDDCGPSKKKKGRRSPRFGSEEALDLADALDGYAIAEIGSRIVHVRVRCDSIVQKVKCADANGLLKVKISRAKMIGSRLMTVQERRVLARIPDAVVRKRVCREE
jgi:hypothetical protein